MGIGKGASVGRWEGTGEGELVGLPVGNAVGRRDGTGRGTALG